MVLAKLITLKSPIPEIKKVDVPNSEEEEKYISIRDNKGRQF